MSRILVVDDDPEIPLLVAEAFQLEGHECTVAASGKKALEWQELSPFDLIFLDYMMPEMDGWEVYTTLRDKGDQTPVYFLSADRELVRKIPGFPPERIIKKPFKLEEILQVLAQHLLQA